jgi:hypothetical protein
MGYCSSAVQYIGSRFDNDFPETGLNTTYTRRMAPIVLFSASVTIVSSIAAGFPSRRVHKSIVICHLLSWFLLIGCDQKASRFWSDCFYQILSNRPHRIQTLIVKALFISIFILLAKTTRSVNKVLDHMGTRRRARPCTPRPPAAAPSPCPTVALVASAAVSSSPPLGPKIDGHLLTPRLCSRRPLSPDPRGGFAGPDVTPWNLWLFKPPWI